MIMLKHGKSFIEKELGPAIVALIGGILTIFGFVTGAFEIILLGIKPEYIQLSGAIIFVVAIVWFQYRFHARLEELPRPIEGEDSKRKIERLGNKDQEIEYAKKWIGHAQELEDWLNEAEKRISKIIEDKSNKGYSSVSQANAEIVFGNHQVKLYRREKKLAVDEFWQLAHKRGLINSSFYTPNSVDQIRYVIDKLRLAAREMLRQNGCEPDDYIKVG